MAGVTSAALEQPLTQSIGSWGRRGKLSGAGTASDGEMVERWRHGGGVRRGLKHG